MEDNVTLVIQPFSHQHHSNLPAPLQAYLQTAIANHQRFISQRPKYFEWLDSHLFQEVVTICVDGRGSDFSTNGIGLLPGTCHVIRSPGLKRCSFRNASYARRIQRTRQRIANSRINDKAYSKLPLSFVVAHHSAGHPDHGCAACNNDTELALQLMRNTAREQRAYFRTGFVIECLLDTDRDSLKIFGRTESVDLAIYLHERRSETDIAGATKEDILRLYQWQRNDIPQWLRFVDELSELLAANVMYARSTENRPFESCQHQEQLIIIGGPLETTDHNAAFLVEKGDSADMIDDLLIGIPIVARNVLQSVLRGQLDDPRIPILISLDYDDPHDQQLVSQVALGLIEALKKQLHDIGSILADRFANESWWQHAPTEFKQEVIRSGGNLFWQAAVYEQQVRELHLVR